MELTDEEFYRVRTDGERDLVLLEIEHGQTKELIWAGFVNVVFFMAAMGICYLMLNGYIK